jgi:hypothetical protein
VHRLDLDVLSEEGKWWGCCNIDPLNVKLRLREGGMESKFRSFVRKGEVTKTGGAGGGYVQAVGAKPGCHGVSLVSSGLDDLDHILPLRNPLSLVGFCFLAFRCLILGNPSPCLLLTPFLSLKRRCERRCVLSQEKMVFFLERRCDVLVRMKTMSRFLFLKKAHRLWEVGFLLVVW